MARPKSVDMSGAIDVARLLDDLGSLEHALDGARMIATLVAHGHAQTDHDRRFGAHACAAVIELVIARLRSIDAALSADEVSR